MYRGIHSRPRPVLPVCATRQLDGWCALHRRARAAGARLAEAKLIRVVLHVSRVVCVFVSVHFPCMSTKGLRLGVTAFYTDVTVI